jgi:hypothetical protein
MQNCQDKIHSCPVSPENKTLTKKVARNLLPEFQSIVIDPQPIDGDLLNLSDVMDTSTSTITLDETLESEV